MLGFSLFFFVSYSYKTLAMVYLKQSKILNTKPKIKIMSKLFTRASRKVTKYKTLCNTPLCRHLRKILHR